MIRVDQPDCFPDDLLVAVSSRADGTMLNRDKGIHATDTIRNREYFCEQNRVAYEDVVYQKISYDDNQSYRRIEEVTENDTTRITPEIHSDVLFTNRVGVGLFLPVADCVATVVYDPVRRLLALLHLGRHSTFTDVVCTTLECFRNHGSDLSKCIVWMSPSAKKDSYHLQWFDFEDDPSWQGFFTKSEGDYSVDLPGYNRKKCIDYGILPEHIFISPIDTTKDPNYFSHRGDKTADRIAVLAMMR